LVTNTNRQVVCFAGTGEIGISDVGANSFDRVKVGCRPLGFVLSPEEDTVYVANQLDDTISVVQLDPARQTKVIELSVSEPTLTSSQLGERLFFDSTLSSDGWFSCHSCHTDGHTNGGLADTFGDGFAGDAKRVPTLLGVHETAPWSWNGAVDDLSEQIRKSVVSTMRGRKPTDEQVRGLVAYVQSFSAPPSVLRARGSLDAKRLDRGRRVFRSIGCAQCHEFGAYTSNDTYHVGFNDRSGSDKFNPPSLRAVSHRWRLLHDNRASSVRDVVKTLGHQNDGELTTEELEDLVYFVESL
jgi:cytochrome c peroxidase